MSWLQFVETDNGKIETKLIKKLEDGKDVTDLEKLTLVTVLFASGSLKLESNPLKIYL